jgi:hypothetical protein
VWPSSKQHKKPPAHTATVQQNEARFVPYNLPTHKLKLPKGAMKVITYSGKLFAWIVIVSSPPLTLSSVEDDMPSMLSSLAYLDAVRASTYMSVSRIGSVDVLSVEEDGVEKEIGLCHLPFLGAFSIPPEVSATVRIPDMFPTHRTFLAALLAVQHLNTGDGSVIPEIEGLNKKCNLRFTTEAFDTYRSPNAAVNHALRVMNRQPLGQPPSNLPSPCMFLGAESSSSSIALSIVSSLRKIPVFSPISQSTALDSKEQHPLFGRLCSHVAADVLAVLRFYKEILGVKHLAVVHVNNDYGISVRRHHLQVCIYPVLC